MGWPSVQAKVLFHFTARECGLDPAELPDDPEAAWEYFDARVSPETHERVLRELVRCQAESVAELVERISPDLPPEWRRNFAGVLAAHDQAIAETRDVPVEDQRLRVRVDQALAQARAAAIGEAPAP